MVKVRHLAALACGLACLFTSQDAWAQVPTVAPNETVVNQTDVISDITDQRSDEERALPAVLLDLPSQRPPANADEIVFVLTALDLQGLTLFPTEEVAPIYADKIGQEVTLEDVFAIAREVQSFHRKNGYLFSRVFVPRQEIVGGVVQIRLLESRIDEVVIEEPAGPVGPVLELIKRMATPLNGLANPTLADLEAVILRINDIPGMERATFVPSRGSSGPGAVRLFLNVERKPFAAQIIADNRQSPVLGEGLVGGTFAYQSYTQRGSTSEWAYFNSVGWDGTGLDLDERNTFQFKHSLFVGDLGTKLTNTVLYSQSKPGDTLAPIGFKGTQFTATFEAEHPIIRTRPFSLWGYGGFEWTEQQTEVGSSGVLIADDSTRVLFAGLRALQRDSSGYTSARLEFRQGLDFLGASQTGDTNLSRFDHTSSFSLVRLDLEREQILNDNFALYGRARAQYSANPLLASEEMAIGGQQFGRAYDPAEFTGDSGIAVAGELRYRNSATIQGVNFDYEFYGFGDISVIANRAQGQPEEQELISVGAGLRLALPQDYSLEMEIARPLKPRLSRTQERNTRVFLNFAKKF